MLVEARSLYNVWELSGLFPPYWSQIIKLRPFGLATSASPVGHLIHLSSVNYQLMDQVSES